MKRNITINLAVQRLSMSAVETLSGMKTVTLPERCPRIWNRDEFIHPDPLGYHNLPRSGWHQFQNCLAPN